MGKSLCVSDKSKVKYKLSVSGAIVGSVSCSKKLLSTSAIFCSKFSLKDKNSLVKEFL